jgi:hypothetical protein
MSQDDIFKDPTGASTTGAGGTSGSNAGGGAGGQGGFGSGQGGSTGEGGFSSGQGGYSSGQGGYSSGQGGFSSGQGGSGTGQGGGFGSGQASQAYDSAKDGARSLADQARERVRGYAEDGKRRLADQIDEFVQVVRHAGETMQGGEQAIPAAQYVTQAADRLQDLSRTLRDSNTDELLRRVQRFGNRNRTAIFGGALIAGIALGRFAIASGQNRGSGMRSGGGNDQFGAGRYRVPARRSETNSTDRTQDTAGGGSDPMTPSEGLGTL